MPDTSQEKESGLAPARGMFRLLCTQCCFFFVVASHGGQAFSYRSSDYHGSSPEKCCYLYLFCILPSARRFRTASELTPQARLVLWCTVNHRSPLPRSRQALTVLQRGITSSDRPEPASAGHARNMRVPCVVSEPESFVARALATVYVW